MSNADDSCLANISGSGLAVEPRSCGCIVQLSNEVTIERIRDGMRLRATLASARFAPKRHLASLDRRPSRHGGWCG
jgi:hypothetical protein